MRTPDRWVAVMCLALSVGCGGRSVGVETGAGGVPALASGGATSADAGGTSTGVDAGGSGGSIGGSTNGGTTGLGGAAMIAAAGTAIACPGIPVVAAEPTGAGGACSGPELEVAPLPLDMILLVDRSILNSYALNSDAAVPAVAGQMSRWGVLTDAILDLANSPQASALGASLTFFGIDGSSSDDTNCNADAYAKPVVPLGSIRDTGSQIVTAMRAITPAGLTPTVPALVGIYQYAVAERQRDSTREKAVVLISDGFPTQCALKSPSDVANVVVEAANASIPVRTFGISFGVRPLSIPTMSSGPSFDQIIARSSGKPSYMLDEAAGVDAVKQQLVAALLDIAHSPAACEFQVAPPNQNQVMLTFQPNVGVMQEIPKVGVAANCAKSTLGGWYFDDSAAPTKLVACPCSCSNFGTGVVSVVYGCASTRMD